MSCYLQMEQFIIYYMASVKHEVECGSDCNKGSSTSSIFYVSSWKVQNWKRGLRQKHKAREEEKMKYTSSAKKTSTAESSLLNEMKVMQAKLFEAIENKSTGEKVCPSMLLNFSIYVLFQYRCAHIVHILYTLF